MSDIDDTIINYQYTSVLQDTALHLAIKEYDGQNGILSGEN